MPTGSSRLACRYSHKLMELVRKVLARLGDLPVKPDRFLGRRSPLLSVRSRQVPTVCGSRVQPCPCTHHGKHCLNRL